MKADALQPVSVRLGWASRSDAATVAVGFSPRVSVCQDPARRVATLVLLSRRYATYNSLPSTNPALKRRATIIRRSAAFRVLPGLP